MKGRNRKLKDEPHISGAYIRSLVKQLTSSSTCTKDSADRAKGSIVQNLTKFGECLNETTQTHQPKSPPQQHKKQVRTRRRLQTSKPYQERLLNMAEARREIVSALKSHRAAMKQANDQLSQRPLSHPSFPPTFEQESKTNNLSASDNVYTLNCTALPNQSLGLNLNFHGFNNLETKLYHNANDPSIYSASSSSAAGPEIMGDLTQSYGGGGLHQAMKLPAWLNANESVLLQQHFDYPALPSMDIGEIEGTDGDWHWLAK